MGKAKRIPKPIEDLEKELVEQLGLLRNACETYDKGLEPIAKHLALNIRVLVHLHGKSRALLDQLGLLSGVFFDTAGPVDPENLVSEMRLLSLRLDPTGGRYIPKVSSGGHIETRLRAFVNWWNDPVIIDRNRQRFSRKDLVLNVADTDGGAHVDPELEEAYMALSRENSLGWIFSKGDAAPAPLAGKPELACVRQIAHELLMTIHQFAPKFSQHAVPVIPAGPA